jgi:arylsulfatase A-like enzyme
MEFYSCTVRRLLILSSALVLSISSGLALETRIQSVDRPNIVLLLTDDQRWDALGATGGSAIQTPHLDRLASRGIVFENTFVTTSICATSRASILTGQYARRHGVWDFRTELTSAQLTESYLGVLKAAGYKIGFIGKWGIGDPPRDWFDYDRTFPGQGEYFLEKDGKTRHLTSVMGDQAVEFLRNRSAGEPFCLSVSFKAPHVQDSYDLSQAPFPSDPALATRYETVEIEGPPDAQIEHFSLLPEFLKNSENRMRWAVRFWGPARYQESVKGYFRLITGVDVAVGRILDELETQGLSENTVIVFTSDNGFFLGEFGLAGKWLPYEDAIRVPLIVYDPRSGSPAGRRQELALNIDVAPTIVALAQQQIPLGMQGKSLVPVIRSSPDNWRGSFFYEHLFEHPRIPPVEAVRTNNMKYVRYLEPKREELYDLDKDPMELKNLVSEPGYRQELQALRVQFEVLRTRAK